MKPSRTKLLIFTCGFVLGHYLGYGVGERDAIDYFQKYEKRD